MDRRGYCASTRAGQVMECPAVETVSTSRAAVTSIAGSACNRGDFPNAGTWRALILQDLFSPHFSKVCDICPMNIQMELAESRWLLSPDKPCLAPTLLCFVWMQKVGRDLRLAHFRCLGAFFCRKNYFLTI